MKDKFEDVEGDNFKLREEARTLREELEIQRIIMMALVREKQEMLEYSSDELEEEEEATKPEIETDDQN